MFGARKCVHVCGGTFITHTDSCMGLHGLQPRTRTRMLLMLLIPHGALPSSATRITNDASFKAVKFASQNSRCSPPSFHVLQFYEKWFEMTVIEKKEFADFSLCVPTALAQCAWPKLPLRSLCMHHMAMAVLTTVLYDYVHHGWS